MHPDTVEFLRGQNWAGNVRELENVIRKVLLLAQGYTINVEHARAALVRPTPSVPPKEGSLVQLVDELLSKARAGELQDAHAQLIQTAERELFSRAIQLAGGNQARAARWVGVSRLTMREKLLQFGIHPAQDRD
jgi:DNA-binding NtrC family response regulator